jgi:hypothetical protein
MQPFGKFPSYYGNYSGLNPGYLGQSGRYAACQNPLLNSQNCSGYPTLSTSVTSSAALPDGFPFCFLNYSDSVSQARLLSGRDPDPAMLWSRGISSPCFRHDHHVIVRNSDPPFSAGNWETDWRHMIEVQFDQFGVASDCRSTWGRLGPWRANRHRYSPDEAHSKLQTEIAMLTSRLGLNLNIHDQQAGRDLGVPFPSWANGNGYQPLVDNFRYIQPKIAPICSLPQKLIFPSSHLGFRSNLL